MISIIKKFLKISDEDSKFMNDLMFSKRSRVYYKQISIPALNKTAEELIRILNNSSNKPIWFEEFKVGFYSKGSCTGLEMLSMRNQAFKVLLEKYENKIPSDDFDLIVFFKYISYDCFRETDTKDFQPNSQHRANTIDIINMDSVDIDFLDMIDFLCSKNKNKPDLCKKLNLLYINPPLFLESKELVSEVYKLRGKLVLEAAKQLGLKDPNSDYDFFGRYANLNFFYARLYKGDYDIYKITKKYL